MATDTNDETTTIEGKMPGRQDEDASLKASLNKIKHKLFVMSGKGGVGKTSVSVNLAIALAEKGFRVGLMDVDIHGPDVPRMLGIATLLEGVSEKKLLPNRYSPNLSFVSIESLMPNKDDAIIWRGPMKHAAIRQFVGDVMWGELDYLLIDSPPGTGDEPLTVAQTIPEAHAIIVTTPQEVALADVRKSIAFCRTLKMDITGIIENMSGFTCPHCQETISLFGAGGGEKTARLSNLRFLGHIPFDLKVVMSADKGVTLQKVHKDSIAANAFRDIAENVSNLHPV